MASATRGAGLNDVTRLQGFGRSQVQVLGESLDRCGYCGQSKSSKTFGAWFYELDVMDYQDLLDAGWRRSGCYLYRPDLKTSCCQQFAIRLSVDSFVPSSSHRKVLKRFQRFIEPSGKVSNLGKLGKCSENKPTTPVGNQHDIDMPSHEIPHDLYQLIKHKLLDAVARLDSPNFLQPPLSQDVLRAVIPLLTLKRRQAGKNRAVKGQIGKEDCGRIASPFLIAELSTNAAMVLTSLERKFRKEGRMYYKEKILSRQMQIGATIASSLKFEKDVSDWNISVLCANPGWINISLENSGDSDLELSRLGLVDKQTASAAYMAKVCKPLHSGTAEDLSTFDDAIEGTGDICSQRACHQAPSLEHEMDDAIFTTAALTSDEEENSADGISVSSSEASPRVSSGVMPQKVSVLGTASGRQFETSIARSSFVEDEFQLYQLYQMTIHHDSPSKCDRKSYERFLVDSPLVPVKSIYEKPGPASGYGSFHVRYAVDGHLFAVGVIDILPNCLSSVYFFYDPSYGPLSPGVLSALKEIQWVQHTCAFVPELRYYYMGYYIHTCPKMKYKAAYKPSDLLCEETRRWVPSTHAISALESLEGRTVRLAPPGSSSSQAASSFTISDEELDRLVDQSSIALDDCGHCMPYGEFEEVMITQFGMGMRDLRNNLRGFIKLVGREKNLSYLHFLSLDTF